MIDLNDYDNGEDSEEGNSRSENTSNDNNKKKKLRQDKDKKVNFNEEEEVVSSSNDFLDEEAEEESGSENDRQESEDKSKEVKAEDIEDEILSHNEEDDEVHLEKLHELLFCIQGIGKYSDEAKTIYQKDDYCEPSLRDIHRFLRKDDPENPFCKHAILNWNICESDIIPLLLNYENNEKIQQLCLVILVDLTEPLPDVLERRQTISALLSKLNKFLINSKLIELLSRSLNDASQKLREGQILKEELKKEEKENQASIVNQQHENLYTTEEDNNLETEEVKAARMKKLEMAAMKRKIAEIEIKSQNIIELVLVLIKQITALYNTNDLSEASATYSILLSKLVEYKILDALIFYSNNFDDKFTQKISGCLLEMTYYLTRLFTPKCIFELAALNSGKANYDTTGRPLTELQRIIQEEEMERYERQKLRSSRPNNFGTRIKVVRPIDNTSFVISNVNQFINNPKQFISEKTNIIPNQLHKGKGRNAMLLKNKKIPQSQIAEEVYMINNNKLKISFSTSVELSQQSYTQVLINMKIFFENYLKNCLNGLIGFFFYLLGRPEQLEKYDVFNLMSVMEFFIDFNRLSEYSRMRKEEEDKTNSMSYPNKNRFNMTYLKESLSPDMINYCYNSLYEQLIMNKKTERKILNTFPAISYFKQVLYAAYDSYKFKSFIDNDTSNNGDNEFNFTLNVMIQDSLLTKDFSRVIKSMFLMFNEHYHPYDFLYDLIEFTELYFGTLELFSKKRSMKIKKKVIKRNKKEDDEEDQYLKEIEEMKKRGEDDYENEDDDLSDDEKFIERDLNVNDEAKCLIDYNILDKVFLIFNQENITSTTCFNLTKRLHDLKNGSKNVIKFITNLFDRIVNKVKYTWIFYQMNYLMIINNLFNDSLFNNDIAFVGTRNIFLKIIHEYFKVFKTNKLLSIESLFHYSGISTAEMIMSNYEYDQPNTNKKNEDYIDEEVDMNQEFVPDEGEEYYNPNKPSSKYKKWTEEDDMILINNYFEFETNSNLMLVLTNQLSDRTEKDIIHRIRKLKVKKGREKAMKKFNKYHHKVQPIQKHRDDSVATCSINLAEKAKDEAFKMKLNNVISILCAQIDSTKNRKELLGKYESVLIPMSNDEIELYEDEDFINLLLLAGLNRKTDEKKFFYIDEKLDGVDVEIIKDKIEKFALIINENIEENNPEREEKKEKHKKKHKHDNEHHSKHKHKSHHKKGFLDEFKIIDLNDEINQNKDEEEEIHDDEGDDNNQFRSDDIVMDSSSKKKKKLKKRLRDNEENDVEMD